MKRASIVINTYNRADYLPNAIRSIFAQSYGEIELVVVNGPSTDDTNLVLERLIQQGNRIKVRDCPSRNLSESRNIGIAASSGDVVFFIDDDAVAHREWVSRIMAQYASPQVGAVGGFTIDHTGISFQCKYTVCDRRGNARFLSDLDPAQVLRAGNGFCFPSLLGTNCSFRASELEAIGGFDEVFAYMLDETDVCARIYDRNKLILTVQDAFVFHKYAPSHSRNSERIPTSLLAPARSKVYYSFKHAPEKSLDSHTLFHDITQYRKDIEFANRWYLDHKKISPAHFTKLSKELDQGIAEGLKLGMDSSNFSKTSAHLANWFAGAGQFERIRAPHGGQIPRTDCVAHEPPMRIYFVSQGYPPNDTSGIARWTHECAVRLADRGHEVHVLTRTSSRTDHVDFIDGVWVHFLDDQFDDDQIYAAPIQIPDSISRRATAVLKELKRSEQVWGVDIVSAPIWDVEGLFAAAYLHKPVALSLHTTYALALPFKKEWQQNVSYKRKHVDRVIAAEKWLLEHSHFILANTTEVVREIETAYDITLDGRPGLAVVPHGFDVGETKNSSSVDDCFNVLFVGRLEERKGPDILLAALLELKDLGLQIKVKFAGRAEDQATEYSKKLAAAAEEIAQKANNISLQFLGYVSDDELAALYEQADVFVAPSRFESFGLILIEAMARGKPVIASDVGGMREVVTHGRDGLLFDLSSIASLSQAMRRLILDSDLRSTLGRAAQATYQSKFTGKAMADGLESFFARMIKREN